MTRYAALNQQQYKQYIMTNSATMYSETCEIRTHSGRAKSVPNSEASLFQGAISTENHSLEPDEVSLFHGMCSFPRVAIQRFQCSYTPTFSGLLKILGMTHVDFGSLVLY
jgi:hypothetical protein